LKDVVQQNIVRLIANLVFITDILQEYIVGAIAGIDSIKDISQKNIVRVIANVDFMKDILQTYIVKALCKRWLYQTHLANQTLIFSRTCFKHT
jgi:hypothetical protein